MILFGHLQWRVVLLTLGLVLGSFSFLSAQEQDPISNSDISNEHLQSGSTPEPLINANETDDQNPMNACDCFGVHSSIELQPAVVINQ